MTNILLVLNFVSWRYPRNPR